MTESHKRVYRHPKYKTSYRIKNWSEYEKSLRNRGDITIWLSRDAIDAWTPKKNGKRGGQQIYSDIAIETSLTLRLVFHLPLRQGEWHAKKHGGRQRKRWKKLHLGVDENGRILASKVTDGHEQDPFQVPDLLAQLEREIDLFVGDGIYDQVAVYEAVGHHSSGARVIVPPRKDAALFNNPIRASCHRDNHIAEIRSKGRSEWKRQSGYYLQSHAENVFYRYKKIIGGRLRAKNDEAQKREAVIGSLS